MNKRICKLCNEEFIPKTSRQLYCKKDVTKRCPSCGDEFIVKCQPNAPTTCSKKECKRKAGALASLNCTRTCKICGSEFRPTSSTQQYCNKPVVRTCSICGNDFMIQCTAEQYNRQTCSEKCANELASKHRQKTYMQLTKTCILCGEEFHPRSNTQVVCDKEVHYGTCKVCGKKFPLAYRPSMNLCDLRKTCSDKCHIEMYRGINPFNYPGAIEKYRKTSLERYGTAHPMQSKEVKSRVFASYLDRTGYDHPAHNPDTLKGKDFKISSLEKKVATVLNNNRVKYEQQKLVRKENIFHKFDFYLPTYNIFVDVDGVYYHGYIDDSNGEQVSEDRDNIRTYLIDPNQIYVVLKENSLNSDIDELLSIIKNIDNDCFSYSEYMFKWCRSIDFPYPIYDEARLRRDYQKLCEYSADHYNSHAKLGLSTIRHFHRSIYDAKVGNYPSIKEAWSDDNILKKVIHNRMIYKNDADPSKILAGFYISKIVPKVSVFNPVLARYLTSKYLSDFNEVCDPFSGFSGRLLGVTSLGKSYKGHDINEEAVKEAQTVIKFHTLNASVFVRDIFKLDSVVKGECLLTCPPYNKKESYSIESKFMSCDEWIQLILKKYDCDRYIFVVDETTQFKNNVVEEIVTKSYFTDIVEYVIVIDQ